MIASLAGAMLHVVEPLGLIWLALVAAAAWKFYRKQKREAWAVTALVIFMWIFGATFVPGSILATLEEPYAGLDIDKLTECDAIMLLGGGTEPAKFEVGQMRLNDAGDRVLMALAVARRGKAPVIYVGGDLRRRGPARLEEGKCARDWLREEGGVTNRVVALVECSNTRDEAQRIRSLAESEGLKSVALVTSAFHMRRAAAVFRTTNPDLAVHEVPCDFRTLAGRFGSPTVTLIPKPGGFTKMSVYLHEVVGWYYYRLRGWIDSAAAAQKTPSFRQ